jgi:hypothetical protein
MAGQHDVAGEPQLRQVRRANVAIVPPGGEVEELHGISIGNTVALSEDYLNGKMSPSEYADRRARLIGKPGLVGSILAPLLGLSDRG